MATLMAALWLAVPALCGGLAHVVVIKAGALRALAALPLDCGRSFRGRRIFGDNKTVRGVVTMIGATTVFALLEAMVAERCGFSSAGAPFASVPPALLGALLGTGYILGELPNSFFKRQLQVPPGAAGRGAWRVVTGLVDQLDSLVGALALLRFAVAVPLAVVAVLLAITLVVHPAVGLLMVALGLKPRVG